MNKGEEPPQASVRNPNRCEMAAPQADRQGTVYVLVPGVEQPPPAGLGELLLGSYAKDSPVKNTAAGTASGALTGTSVERPQAPAASIA